MLDLCLIMLPNPALENPKMYYSLGILYLAAACEERGFSVEVADFRDGERDLPEARFYGFSCTTPEITYAKEIAKQVSGQTIVGGAHPSLLPEDCVSDFNYIIRGEGEEVLPKMLNGSIRAMYDEKPAIISMGRIKDLNNLPFPAWDKIKNPFSETLFPGERYGMAQPAATVIASRGCPFTCSFCGNIYRTPVIYRSVNNICQELYELKKRGISYFRFEDDNFTLHPQFSQLCVVLASLNIHFKCHTRSDLLTLKQARAMRASGCEECGLGVESGDELVLKLNNKKVTVEDHMIAVGMIREAGMRVKTYFITGLPGETDLSIELTKDFVRYAQPDKWTVATFTPYPGCDVWNNPRKYGVTITNPDWSKWWNFCEEGYNHVLDNQTPEQMWARYLDFYNWLKEEAWKL